MRARGVPPTGIRNRALIAALHRTGLRIGEALALRLANVDLEACSIRVLHRKVTAPARSGSTPGAVALLERWLEQRRQLGLGRAATIFCTVKGDPVRQKYVRALLARLRAKTGIEKRVHAHGFRHTHATELRREGVDIGIISKQLGHSSITTTARTSTMSRLSRSSTRFAGGPGPTKPPNGAGRVQPSGPA